MMQKYIGRVIEIIYQDNRGAFTKRRIRVIAVDGDKVKAYCYAARAPRVFAASRIMAAQPAAVVS